jgi:dihydrofolate reductase
MSCVVYYVAASVDGCIATSDGGVEWLAPFEGRDYGYDTFLASVNALVMGRTTYEQVLRLGPWPYAGRHCVVFTHAAPAQSQADVVFTAEEPATVMADLRAAGRRRVWLVGGGRLAGSFQEVGLISEYIVYIMPVTLGAGIPLFRPHAGVATLRLTETCAYPDGVVRLTYTNTTQQ